MTKTQRYISNCTIWKRGFTIALSMFTAGYNMGIVNTLEPRWAYNFNWTPEDQASNLSWLVAIFSLASIVGPGLSVKFIRKFGSYDSILLINWVSTVGMILQCIVNYPVVLVGRFIVGLALGLTLTVAPLYINELTPLERRAAVGSLEGAMLDTGMLRMKLIGDS